MSFLSPMRRRCLTGLLSVGLLITGVCGLVWADPTGPTPSDRHVSLAVTSMLRKDHLSRHPLDAEMSERCLKMFLRDLDPLKVYFYQSDIDAFSKYKDTLDEAAQRGDVGFAYMVYKTYLARVDERLKMIDELLAAKHDFTVDEEMVVDKDLLAYPKTPAEAFDRWRKRIKYDLLQLKADKAEEKADGEEGRVRRQDSRAAAFPAVS